MFTIIGTVAGIATLAASGVGISAVLTFLYNHEFKFGKSDDVGTRGPMGGRPGMDRHNDTRRKMSGATPFDRD